MMPLPTGDGRDGVVTLTSGTSNINSWVAVAVVLLVLLVLLLLLMCSSVVVAGLLVRWVVTGSGQECVGISPVDVCRRRGLQRLLVRGGCWR